MLVKVLFNINLPGIEVQRLSFVNNNTARFKSPQHFITWFNIMSPRLTAYKYLQNVNGEITVHYEETAYNNFIEVKSMEELQRIIKSYSIYTLSIFTDESGNLTLSIIED